MAKLETKQADVLTEQSICNLWAYLCYKSEIIYLSTGKKVICKMYHCFTH